MQQASAQNRAPPQPPPKPSALPPPLSPGAQARERDRVTVLLEINSELLKEILALQAQGKGGSVAQPPQSKEEEGKAEDRNQKPASKEYVEYVSPAPSVRPSPRPSTH